MNHRPSQPDRILAIDRFVSGLGFVVLEGPESLISWGLKSIAREKPVAPLRIVDSLIELYDPNMIIVEDCRMKGCRLGEQAKDLIEEVAVLASARRIKCQRCARQSADKVFSRHQAHGKQQIAVELAEWFPELARHLPRPRKPSVSEDPRMSIFDALALAVVHYEKRRFRPASAD